ncbi:MAG: DUF3592 domain-containing protein [Planctomycetia bacterium]|nr:DUF3592 domain-containing protein [Planctomycetia bacterium]
MEKQEIKTVKKNEDLWENMWAKIASDPRGRILIGLAIGLTFLILGLYELNKVNRLARDGIEAPGTIVSIQKTVKRKTRIVVYSTIQYKDKAGTDHQKKFDYDPEVWGNKEITVIYLPDSPKSALLKGPDTFSRLPSYIYLGISCIGWAAVLYNLILRKRQTAAIAKAAESADQ